MLHGAYTCRPWWDSNAGNSQRCRHALQVAGLVVVVSYWDKMGWCLGVELLLLLLQVGYQ